MTLVIREPVPDAVTFSPDWTVPMPAPAVSVALPLPMDRLELPPLTIRPAVAVRVSALVVS